MEANMSAVENNSTFRGSKGLQTRERLLGAALGEFKRVGMAAADIGAITSAAGVARSTFFFHFPTKEHVLIELERREEGRIARELTRFFAKSDDLVAALTKTVDAIESLERRLGSRLFKDFLALHFSASRPPQEVWTNHPVMVAVIEELERARERGNIPPKGDPFHSGVFFLVGLYALLLTLPESPAVRAPVLKKYVATTLYGMHPI
jgi:AcrR family transcriptional regulator